MLASSISLFLSFIYQIALKSVRHVDLNLAGFSRKHGMLLLELTIAMVFVSVALVGLLGAFTMSIRAHGEIDGRAQACLLLEKKAAEIESDSFFFAGEDRGGFPSHEMYSWRTETAETRTPSLHRITLAVSWRDNCEEVVLYLRERPIE